MKVLIQLGGMVLYYFILYGIYLFFKKLKITLFYFLILNTLFVILIVFFFYIVDIYKIPKWLYDKKTQKDACIDESTYHTIMMKSVLKYVMVYIPFAIVLFSLVFWRNKFPGLSNVKVTLLYFFILYGLSAYFSEFASYFIHKALHSELLFPFHKQHHEYISPVCASIYDGHPIESFFWNLFPTFSFSLLFGIPIHILYVQALVGTIVALLVHSGYRIIDDGMMDMAHHDLHHERMKCNYSSPLVDKIMGTYIYREPEKVYPRFDKKENIFPMYTVHVHEYPSDKGQPYSFAQ